MQLTFRFSYSNSYYYNFDYRTYAVSPRLGQLLNKQVLYEQNRTLSDISSHFKRTYVAVEDPFVTDNNCGGVYNSGMMNRWRSAFNDVRFGLKVNPKDIVRLLTCPRDINYYETADEC